MHYDFETICDLSDTYAGDELSLTLARGDTAWNPVSARYNLFGPGTVTYRFAVDGGVTAKVTK